MTNLKFTKMIIFILFLFSCYLILPQKADAAGFGWARDKFLNSSCHTVLVRVKDANDNPIAPDSLDFTYILNGSVIWEYSGGGATFVNSPCLDASLFTGNPTLKVDATAKKAGYNDFYGSSWSIQWSGGPTATYKWVKDIYMSTTGTPSNNYQYSPMSSDWSTDPVYYNYSPPFVVKGDVLPSSGFTSINAASFFLYKCCSTLLVAGRFSGVWDPTQHTFTLPPQAIADDGHYQWASYLESWTNPSDLVSHNPNDVVSARSFFMDFGVDRVAPTVSNCSITPNGNDIDVNLDPEDVTSGVFSGQVEVSVNGSNWTTNGLPSGGDTISNFTYSGTAGNNYTFRFRARDNAVNASGEKMQWSKWFMCGSTGSLSPVTVHVREVNSTTACGPTEGVAFTNVSPPPAKSVSINASGIDGESRVVDTGSTTYSLLHGSHDISISNLPVGFNLVGTSVDPSNPTNTINVDVSGASNFTFCVQGNNEPWFQTNFGDVRFSKLINPLILGGQKGATDLDNPGIFFSSIADADLGSGGAAGVSLKGWLVNKEYSYNDKAKSRFGTMSYSFYKSKARQEGVEVTKITSPLNGSDLVTDGVYEVEGNLDIDTSLILSASSAKRIVLLVNGDVNINADVVVAPGSLLIIASKNDIVIDESVGVGSTSPAISLEGVFTAERNIDINGDGCAAGGSDLRLNVGGSLIANADKPFAGTGDKNNGGVNVKRELCSIDNDNPTLSVSSRLDFITQMTDFYKTSYTKWEE